MQGKLFIAVFALAVATYYLGTTPAQSQTDSDQVASSWRHLALTQRNDQRETESHEKIVQLGAEGWQLVDVENFVSAGETIKTVYYFKKPG
ncbi:MAG: hypothetical protein AB8B91_13180 [Rubripirellula sp.]